MAEPLNMAMGWERARAKEGRGPSGVWGVVGQPWIWSQQSSQTRESTIGDSGDSNSVMAVLRGGCRNARLDASSSAVTRDVHAPQKDTSAFATVLDPRVRQRVRLGNRKTYVFALEKREGDAAVEVVAGGGRRVGLQTV